MNAYQMTPKDKRMNLNSLSKKSGTKTLRPLESLKLISKTRNKILLQSATMKFDDSARGNATKTLPHSYRESESRTRVGDSLTFATPRKDISQSRAQCKKCSHLTDPQVILKLPKDNVYHVYYKPDSIPISRNHYSQPVSIEIPHRFELSRPCYNTTDIGRINAHFSDWRMQQQLQQQTIG